MPKFLIAFFIFIIFFIPPAISQDLPDVYKNVSPSVVIVQALDSQDGLIGQGTGFFIDKAGDVITNLHVISESHKVVITLENGETYSVEGVLAHDIASDLVLLAVNNISSQMIHPLVLCEIPPEIGEEIVIIGCPEGPGEYVSSMTRGIVSSVQNVNDYGLILQIDAAISPGSSGSPVINLRRDVVGVATFGYLKGQKQNFAVASKQVLQLINNVALGGNRKPIPLWNLTSEEEIYAAGLDLLRKGDYEKALYYLEGAINKNAGDSNVYFAAANCKFELSRYAESILDYDKVLGINPNNIHAWNNKGNALCALGKYEESIECYERAIDLNPLSTEAWSGKGNVLYSIGKFGEALICYDNAIKSNPRLAEAWCNRGNAFYSLGKCEDAIKCYDQAINSNPLLTEAWYDKGIALFTQNKHVEAIDCYNQAITINPHLAEVWEGKGMALSAMGKHEEAIKCYDQAININPHFAEAWMDKGTTLLAQGKYVEAFESNDQAITINPQLVEAWYRKGIALSAQNRHYEAIECYNKALQIDPLFAKAWDGKSVSLSAQGEYAEAINCSNLTLEINPFNSQAWNHKGSALSALGLSREAEYCYNNSKILISIPYTELPPEKLARSRVLNVAILAPVYKPLGPDGADFYKVLKHPELSKYYPFFETYYEPEFLLNPAIEIEGNRSYLVGLAKNNQSNKKINLLEFFLPAYENDMFDCSMVAALLEYNLERNGITASIAISSEFNYSASPSIRHAFVIVNLNMKRYYIDIARHIEKSGKLEVIAPTDPRYYEPCYRTGEVYKNIYSIIDAGLYKEFCWWDSPLFITRS